MITKARKNFAIILLSLKKNDLERLVTVVQISQPGTG
jgi:hypothetical protein